MLKKIHSKKAQNTAEYAILIALVIGGVVAMQTYAQRSLQARVRETSRFMASTTGNEKLTGLASVADGGKTDDLGHLQYEPYYTRSAEKSDKTSTEIRNKVDSLNQLIASGEAFTSKIEQSENTVYQGAIGQE